MAKYSCFAKYPCLPKGNNGGGLTQPPSQAVDSGIVSCRWRHRKPLMAVARYGLLAPSATPSAVEGAHIRPSHTFSEMSRQDKFDMTDRIGRTDITE